MVPGTKPSDCGMSLKAKVPKKLSVLLQTVGVHLFPPSNSFKVSAVQIPLENVLANLFLLWLDIPVVSSALN